MNLSASKEPRGLQDYQSDNEQIREQKLMADIDKLKKKREADVSKYKSALEEIKSQSQKKITKFKEKLKKEEELSNQLREDLDEANELLREKEEQLSYMHSQHQQDIKAREKQFRQDLELIQQRLQRDTSMSQEQLKLGFQTQLDEKNREISDLKRELQNQENQVQGLELDLQKIQRQIKQAQISITDKEDEFKQKNDQYSRLQEQDHQNQQLLKQRDETIISLQEEIRLLDSQVREMKFRCEQSEQLTSTLQQENFQLSQLRSDVDQENKRYQVLLTRLQIMFGIDQRLSMSLAEIERNCRRVISENSQHAQVKEELDFTISELQKKLNFFMQKDEDSQLQYKSAQDSILRQEKQIQNLLRDQQRQSSQSTEEINRYKIMEQELQSKLDESHQQVKMLIQQQAELETLHKKQLQETVQKTQKEFFSKLFDIMEIDHRFSPTLDTIENNYKKFQQELTKTIKFNETLNLDLQEMEKKLEQRKSKDEETNLMILKLQEKNLRLERQISNMSKDMGITSSYQIEENKKRQLENKALQQNLDEAQSQLKQLLAQNQQSDQQCRQLLGENQVLKEKCNELSIQVVKVKAQMAQQEGALFITQEKINDQAFKEIDILKKENAELNQELKRRIEKIEILTQDIEQIKHDHRSEIKSLTSEIQYLSHQLQQSQLSNREKSKGVDREQLLIQKEYEQVVRDIQRKNEEQTNELKNHYEERIYSLKQKLIEHRVSPEKFMDTRSSSNNTFLNSGYSGFVSSNKRVHSPQLIASSTSYTRGSETQQGARLSDLYDRDRIPSARRTDGRSSSNKRALIQHDESNPEKTIEELKLEIQQQKRKLSQIQLSVTDTHNSTKKVQFQATPDSKDIFETSGKFSDIMRSRPVLNNSSKKDLASTFNQMRLRD